MDSVMSKIEHAVAESYCSFKEPRLDFIQKVYNADPYRSLIDELGSIYSVEDTTDTNYDRSFALTLRNGELLYGLRLSMAGRFAFLWRVTEQKKLQVLTERKAAPEEIVALLKKHNFEILDKQSLLTNIDLQIPGDEASYAYNVLFFELDDTYMFE